MKVAEFIAELGFDLRGEGDLKRFEAGMAHAERRTMAFAAAIGRYGALAGAALGAFSVGLAKSVITTSAQFEGFEVALETLEGSADKAQTSMKWISQFAKTTPYDVAGVTDAFIKLRAYGIDPTNGTLRTLGDSASAMNKPLNQAVEMFADAATFSFERLKEFGIVASQKGDQVTFSWTKNGKQMTEVVRKNGDDIRKFVLENLGDRFNGAMLRQSKTWDGMMSNLGDSWEDFKLRIGRGGFFEAVKGRLGDLLDYIGELDKNGTLDRWSKNLGIGFKWVADGISDFAVRMKGHFDFLSKLYSENSGKFEQFFGPIKSVLLALAVRMFPVTALFAALALALEDVLMYMRGGDSVIGDFIETLAKFLGVEPQQVADVLGNIATAAGWLLTASLGVTLFATALRSLSGALLVLKGMTWAAGLLSGLFGAAGGATATAGAATTGGAAAAAAAPGLIASIGALAAGVLGAVASGTLNLAQSDLLKTDAEIERQRYLNQGVKDHFTPGGTPADDERRRDRSVDNWAPEPQPGGIRDTLNPSANRSTAKGDRLGPKMPSAERFGGAIQQITATVARIDGHLAAMSSDAMAKGVNAHITDARDMSNRPVNVVVNQTVTQASAAPGAAAQATGNAVASAAAGQAARISAESGAAP